MIVAALLNWKTLNGFKLAQLGPVDDGVSFELTYHGTCYRRGKWRLLIEVCGGLNHEKFGCFDLADQPMRYYHLEANALSEAEEIAKVLWADRQKHN
jgi:hypothetical protein